MKELRGKHEALFIEEGMVVIHDFLDKDNFQKVYKVFYDIIENDPRVARCTSGDTVIKEVTVARDEIRKIPGFDNFAKDSRLINLLSFAQGRKIHVPCIKLQLVDNSGSDDTDIQKLLHADIFFSTPSVFFFLEDVAEGDGPFCYVKKSQRVSLKRLLFEYKNSISKHPEPSPRVTEKDQQFFHIEETPALVKANTLVVSDNRGFHRRGNARSGTLRASLRINVRYNPLNV